MPLVRCTCAKIGIQARNVLIFPHTRRPGVIGHDSTAVVLIVVPALCCANRRPASPFHCWCCPPVAEIGNYHYGQGHPMKPHRVRMTHNLVVNYGLYRQMEVFRPKPISSQHMTRFHSDDYINFLRVITQDNMQVRCIP